MLKPEQLEQIESILKNEILKYEIESDFFTTTIVFKSLNNFVIIDGGALVRIAQIKPFSMSLNKDFTIELVF
jgi:hypothetical protein